ncbi:MAG TPA: hypothetical protein VL426_03670 [Candidatus Binatia bacterium]|jgi:hypothetical protein|nr:hypothetical protein [Candidatus Binatia bacterium]
MHVATIVRDKAGRHHVRFGEKAQDGGDVTVIDVLNGTDLKELKDRAERFVKELEERK